MDQNVIKSISTQIYKKFPEVAGVQPKIRQQQGASVSGNTQAKNQGPMTFLLTYHANVPGPGGKTIPRWVRVTSDAGGRIMKISTSHGGK